MSLRRLGVERIDLWQLHRIDPKVPRDEQFDAIAKMQKEGLIRHAGLSEVGVEEIKAAQKYFRSRRCRTSTTSPTAAARACSTTAKPTASASFPGFHSPAASCRPATRCSTEIAKRHGATSGQIALAWLLKRAPVMLPIPGTSSVAHLVNVASARLRLTDEDYEALTALQA